MSACVRFLRDWSVWSRGVMVTDPAMPATSPERDLEAVLAQTDAVHFEQLDVDDDLGTRLVDRGDEPGRGGDRAPACP